DDLVTGVQTCALPILSHDLYVVTATDGASRRANVGGSKCRSLAPAPAPVVAGLPRPAARSARSRPSYLLSLPGCCWADCSRRPTYTWARSAQPAVSPAPASRAA